MQRSISWGGIAALSELFEELTAGHVFDCEEAREMCEFDFVEQYIEGNDDPRPRYL